MTQKEFNSLIFSQRHEISKGTKCNASWQVRTVGGSAAYAVSCRDCGTVIQSGCTPKCLLHHPPLTEANTSIMQAEESADEGFERMEREGAAVASEGQAQNVSVGKRCECYDPFPNHNNICRNCDGWIG